MSKSKPQETTATTDTSQHIPDWLEGAGQGAVFRAEDLSNRPYTPYTGEMVAPQSADTLRSYQQVRDLQGQGAPAFGQSLDAYGRLVGSAAPITAGGVNDNTNSLYGNFNQNVMNPAQGLLGSYLNGGPATAAQVGQNAATLMSPYAQNVIDPTLAAGEQAREIARQKIAGNAGLPNVAGLQQGYGQKDASLLQAIGADQQNYGQRVDNAGYGQFLDEQGWPIQNLDLLLGAVGGIPYSTTGTGLNTQKQILNKNAAGGILGGALSGASTGAMVSGGNPYVAAGGAVIGAIGGALN